MSEVALLAFQYVVKLLPATGDGICATSITGLGTGALTVTVRAVVWPKRPLPSHSMPQSNGMVERFNGRINELLQQTRLGSRADLRATSMNYLKLYNHHIPQRARDAKALSMLNPLRNNDKTSKQTQKRHELSIF